MSKGAGLIVLIVSVLALPPSAQQEEPPRLLTFLSYTATLSIFADTALTYEAIWNHNCYESNLLWASVMKYPPVVMALDGLIGAGVTLLAERLYRTDNKALAWALVIGVNIVQAYCLYYHWQLRRDARWGK
jgi:hypothetical protein